MGAPNINRRPKNNRCLNQQPPLNFKSTVAAQINRSSAASLPADHTCAWYARPQEKDDVRKRTRQERLHQLRTGGRHNWVQLHRGEHLAPEAGIHVTSAAATPAPAPLPRAVHA